MSTTHPETSLCAESAASASGRSPAMQEVPLTILRLLLQVSETSAPYNHFSLGDSDRYDTVICTYFRSAIPAAGGIALFEGDGTLGGFWGALKDCIDAKRYDVIHVHSPHLGVLFILAGVLMGRRLLRRSVYTVHNSYWNYKLRNRLLLYPIAALFGRVVCCSHSSLQSLPGLLKVLAGRRLYAVQNGVNLARLDGVLGGAREPQPRGPFTVVSVGSLIDRKDPISVLRAFEQLGDSASRLVFIGDGPLRPALAAEIARSGLERQVEMTGLVPREAVFRYLANADVCVSASLGEGLPVAVLEAMACRCPVVLSDIPPHREIADGADFIPMVGCKDAAGLARAIASLRAMSPTERAVIGARCRVHVHERFSLASMKSAYHNIYLNLLSENGSSWESRDGVPAAVAGSRDNPP